MRGTAVGTTLVAAVLVAAAPAYGKLTEVSGRLSTTGAITVTWHGDRARGCAAAGLCGYRGSTLARVTDGQFQLLFRKGRLRFGFAEVFGPAPVARVRRTEGTGEGGGCVDLAPETPLEMTTSRARTSSSVRIGFIESGLSAGRCAGPDVSLALSQLPRHAIAISRLTHPGSMVDLSGSAPFRAGRFSGTVRSTIKARVRPPAEPLLAPGDRPPPPPRASGPLVRLVDVLVRYRVTGLSGKVSTTFGGLRGPFCASLDSCGVAGTANWAILSAGGSLLIDGEARARPAEHGLRDALVAIRRQPGFINTQGSLRHALGATAATVVRPDGIACHDSQTVLAPDLVTNYDDGAMKFALGGEGEYYPSHDVLRTGCPGPMESDVLGRGAVASGSIPGAAIGRRRLRVAMTGAGRFGGAGYSGSHRSGFTLTLRREAVHYSYALVRRGR